MPPRSAAGRPRGRRSSAYTRAAESGRRTDASWYAEAHRLARAAVPEALLGITSTRPAGVPVATVLELLADLSADRGALPDLVSVNLGHLGLWAPTEAGSALPRRTVHFPNGYEKILAILAACRALGMVPEHGVMNLGFVGNAVALRDDGFLLMSPWFLVELDSPGYGAGPQVAPSSVANHDALVAPLRRHFPAAAWAAHDHDLQDYAVLRRAIATGAQVRVGFEDAVLLPSGSLAGGNADLVDWAVAAARERGRRPASPDQALALVGLAGP